MQIFNICDVVDKAGNRKGMAEGSDVIRQPIHASENKRKVYKTTKKLRESLNRDPLLKK